MIRRLLALITLCLLAPVAAEASGAWTTYLRMQSCNDILALRDTVWLATGEAGLVHYSRATHAFGSFVREPRGLASNALTSLAFDRSGRLWAATPGMGVSYLSSDQSTWNLVNAFDGVPSDTVNVLRADGDTVWIGTRRGIALWDGTQVAGSVPDLGTPSPFRSDNVTGIVVVHDSLFVATSDGVYVARLSQQLATWASVDAGLISTNVLALATDGREVFALASGGAHRWSMTTHQWSVIGAVNLGSVRRMRDGFNTILVNSATGIWKWTSGGWTQLAGSPASVGSGDGGHEFGADPDGVVFDSDGNVLSIQGSPAWTAVTPPGPVGNSIQNILVDDGRVWVNTFADGVSRFDGSTWRNWARGFTGTDQDTAFMDPSFAFTLLRDREGRKWTSHWEIGIERVDDSVSPMRWEHVLQTHGVPASDSLTRHTDGWASAADSSGFVYIGGDTPDRGTLEPMGIDVYTTGPGVPQRIKTWKTTNAGLADNQIRSLSVDKSGTLWAGFAGGGVSWLKLDTTGPGRDTLKLFTPVVGLESNVNFGVVAHGDSIWVLTTSSLRRVRRAERTLVSSLYDIPAGPAPRGAVRPLDVAPDGTVWVGTSDGVRMFKPGGGYEDFKTTNSPLANNEVRAVSVERSGAVWIGTASGLNRYDPRYVAPAPPRISRLALKLYPNPLSLTRLGLDLRLSGNTTEYRGEILDLSGREVNSFSVSGNGRIVWNGRDHDGQLVPPGVYFVHARGGGQEGIARAVVLR